MAGLPVDSMKIGQLVTISKNTPIDKQFLDMINGPYVKSVPNMFGIGVIFKIIALNLPFILVASYNPTFGGIYFLCVDIRGKEFMKINANFAKAYLGKTIYDELLSINQKTAYNKINQNQPLNNNMSIDSGIVGPNFNQNGMHPPVEDAEDNNDEEDSNGNA